MTLRFRSWLPDSALVSPVLLEACDDVVAAWGKRWFGWAPIERRATQNGLTELASRPGEQWRALAGDLRVESSEATQLAFVNHALDHADRSTTGSVADHRLLVALAERLWRDLTDRLLALPAIKATSVASDAGSGRGLLLVYGIGRTGDDMPRLAIHMGSETLVALRKSLCPVSTPSNYPPISLTQAVGDTPITFDAMLGHAAMTGLELGGLAPGDVVVIGRSVSEPVDLRLGGTDNLVATATLADNDGELILIANRD